MCLVMSPYLSGNSREKPLLNPSAQTMSFSSLPLTGCCLVTWRPQLSPTYSSSASPSSLLAMACWTGPPPVTQSVRWERVAHGQVWECSSSSNSAERKLHSCHVTRQEETGEIFQNCCAYQGAKQAEQPVSSRTLSCVFCG